MTAEQRNSNSFNTSVEALESLLDYYYDTFVQENKEINFSKTDFF